MTDKAMQAFVDNLRLQNENTAETVEYFLKDFNEFSGAHLKATPTEIIAKRKAVKSD